MTVDLCLILNVLCLACPKVKKKKCSSKFLFNYSTVKAQSELVQLWLTAANSPQSQSFESALNVSAQSNMKAYKTSVYLMLAGPPLFLHYGTVQSQLRLCSLTHWAIHHRWRSLLWKLAAILPLGKNHLNGAKMAPGKACDAKDFLHLS